MKITKQLSEEICDLVDACVNKVILKCENFEEYYAALCAFEAEARCIRACYETLNSDYLDPSEVKKARIEIAKMEYKSREDSLRVKATIRTKKKI